MLTLAFDTATSVATVALLRDETVLGERISVAAGVLADADELLREHGVSQEELGRLVVGTGPGSFTGIRIGLAAARGLAFALAIPVAGVATLEALATGAPEALPVIDAKRREVFALAADEARAVRPDELELAPGTTCVGDGAVRYRQVLEQRGAEVPADNSPLHVPWARHHAALATSFGPAEAVEPLYVRIPDAEARPQSGLSAKRISGGGLGEPGGSPSYAEPDTR
jgi:tRNA threonylcarbamoyladenosine biosynthesis protein TsaB